MKYVLLIGILYTSMLSLAQANIPLAKSECEQDYLELFKNDTIKMTVAYGYDNVNAYRTNDTENLRAFVKTMTTPCTTRDQKSCGFQLKSSDPYILTRKIIGPDGRSRTLEITSNAASVSSRNDLNIKNPLQSAKSEKAHQMFLQGLENDDVVIYMGHSRDGGGPDFYPPKLRQDGHVDYDWYHKNPENKKQMLSVLSKNPNKTRIVALLACNSIRWFSKGITNQAPSSGIIGTNETYYTLTFSEVFELIENIFSYQCIDNVTIEDIKKRSQIKVNRTWKVPKNHSLVTNQTMDKQVLTNLVELLRSADRDIRKDAYSEIIKFDKKLLSPKMVEEIDAYLTGLQIKKALN